MPATRDIFGARGLKPPIRYGISDRRQQPALPVEDYLRRLFETSAQVIQLREKDLGSDQLWTLVEIGAALARDSGKIFLVNSEIGFAVRSGSDGVHLTSNQDPRNAMECKRSLSERSFIVGKSVHSAHEAVAAWKAGVDYVLLSPIFVPNSKQSFKVPLGLAELRRVCSLVSIPVLALGGVGTAHADSLIRAGAAGFAGISWLNQEVMLSERP